MEPRVYGYARVSSQGQSLERQFDALIEYGIEERDIICDKATGKNFERNGYQSLKSQMLRKGDVLVIKELDRLGRNYTQIKTEMGELAKMGVDLVILDSPMLSTYDKDDLEKCLINTIVLELLAYISESELRKIKRRQREGIKSAKMRGVHCVRPRIETPKNWDNVYAQWKSGEITAVAAMKACGLNRSSFYKLIQITEQSK